jgi:hypothetical protein
LLHIYSLLFGGALFCRIILVSRVTGIIEAVGLERVRIALEDGAVVTYAWDADARSSYDPRFVWEFMDESFRRVLNRNARRCRATERRTIRSAESTPWGDHEPA